MVLGLLFSFLLFFQDVITLSLETLFPLPHLASSLEFNAFYFKQAPGRIAMSFLKLPMESNSIKC